MKQYHPEARQAVLNMMQKISANNPKCKDAKKLWDYARELVYAEALADTQMFIQKYLKSAPTSIPYDCGIPCDVDAMGAAMCEHEQFKDHCHYCNLALDEMIENDIDDMTGFEEEDQ